MKDKAQNEIRGPGVYKEKSYIVEGPQKWSYIYREQYNLEVEVHTKKI